ncbi:unnamed protein product [marine sediment metagenome]|uniref:Uncharacterized protein n=1 Tax=marine sediment metagenome TaxID=412755 RepID=X1SUV6_9ZZZZ
MSVQISGRLTGKAISVDPECEWAAGFAYVHLSLLQHNQYYLSSWIYPGFSAGSYTL